jgi:NADPH:quinone reductase-like Zn-dependent oxidoreductase
MRVGQSNRLLSGERCDCCFSLPRLSSPSAQNPNLITNTHSRLASKSIKVARPTLFPYIATRAEFEGYTAKLFELLADPTFDVPVHKVYDLADVASAHTDLESRGTVGKLLLKI